MAEYPIGADALSVEIVKKAFVWYYRAWSYYWKERPLSCVIHPAESFVELEDEVTCLCPWGIAEEHIQRLRNVFAQPLTFIAVVLPEGQSGYALNEQCCRDASPWLQRFLDQLTVEYGDLRQAASDGRQRERRRQEWRFAEAGSYLRYFDGKTTRLNLNPEERSAYTYTIIENSPNDLYFTESKSGPRGEVIERGDYRKHFHDVGQSSYENIDFFPESDYPTLWRLVKAGRGFKAFPRKLPRIANVSFQAD